MATVDELGRAAAAALRADVHPDVEAGLRRLHADAPAAGVQRRRWWAVGGAAAVVLLAVAAFAVIDRSPGGQGPATVPPTSAISPTVPSTAAPTVTPTSAVSPTVPPTSATSPTAIASTLPASSTPAAPSTVTPTLPSTSVAEPAADFAVFATAPTIDLPPLLVPLPLPGCDPSCPSVVGTDDGTVVAWDAAQGALLALAPDALQAEVVPVDAPGLTVDWLVAVGPDDVAYLFAHPSPGTVEDGLDLVAVPLRGPNAGTIVATAADVGDMSGDTDWAPTATGLVAVGCCDASPVRPAPDRPVTMGWVDSAGRPVVSEAPQLTFRIMPGTFTVTRSDHPVPFDVTEVIESDVLRGMPMLAAAADGSVLVATWPLDGSTWQIGRARPDGSGERLGGPPDGTFVLALDAAGAIVATDDAIARWVFPGYGAATMIDPSTVLGGATFATSAAAVAGILAALRAPDDCEVPPTAELTGTEPHGTGIVARFAARAGCDDSSAGRALAVALAPGPDGRWSAGTAVQASLCRRGVVDGFCV